VGGLGVLAGQEGQPGDGVLGDALQSGGLADSTPLGEVPQDRQDLLVRELGVEQRGALELGEPGLAAPAVEQAVASLAEVIDDEEVAGVASAVEVGLPIAGGPKTTLTATVPIRPIQGWSNSTRRYERKRPERHPEMKT
jgi:hypothetical protein